jgi:hypothetical protein
MPSQKSLPQIAQHSSGKGLKTEMRTTDFTETAENEGDRKPKPLTHWVNPFEADSLLVTHLFSESYPCPSLKSVVVPTRF